MLSFFDFENPFNGEFKMSIKLPYLSKQIPVILHLLQVIPASEISISLVRGSHSPSKEETQDINNLELSLTACYSVLISKRRL